ncbi:hypothetical protein [Thermococcus sp.]|uniref:hypothetical protein n=1 Tax=Thermococcus sp. TaxID=35749 RepID=UPI0026043791|nr:hypothetical protein [Thermococcus sp.]
MPVTKTEKFEVKGNERFTNAFIAYVFGFVGGIPLILMKDTDEFTKIHAAYSSVVGFFFWIAFMGAWHMYPGYPEFGWALYVLALWYVYAVFGAWKMVRGELYSIPVIDGLAKKLISALASAV